MLKIEVLVWLTVIWLNTHKSLLVRTKNRKTEINKNLRKGHGTRLHFFEIFSKFKYFGDILIMLHEE